MVELEPVLELELELEVVAAMAGTIGPKANAAIARNDPAESNEASFFDLFRVIPSLEPWVQFGKAVHASLSANLLERVTQVHCVSCLRYPWHNFLPNPSIKQDGILCLGWVSSPKDSRRCPLP